MPVLQKFMLFLKTQDKAAFVEAMIACFAAPLIKGLRCGTLINLCRNGEDMRRAWCSQKNSLSRRFGVEFAEMSVTDRSVVLFIYRTDLLALYLSRDDTACFLEDMGYNCGSDFPNGCVRTLKERFKSSMPHEIGVFLGYPLDDVRVSSRTAAGASKPPAIGKYTATKVTPEESSMNTGRPRPTSL